MTTDQLFEIFQHFGSFIGVLITIATFWGIISKKPKEAFKKLIRDEVNAAVKPNSEKLDQIEESLKEKDITDLAILRNTITHIYFKYKDGKKIPHYEKDNALYLFTQYEKLGGNSYVKEIIEKIKEWEESI